MTNLPTDEFGQLKPEGYEETDDRGPVGVYETSDPNTITLGPLVITWFADGDDPGVGGITFGLNADGYECFAQFPHFGSTGLSPATWAEIRAALKN